jgi:hypothetical protein
MSDTLLMRDGQGCAAELRDLLEVAGFDQERHHLALYSDGLGHSAANGLAGRRMGGKAPSLSSGS